MRIRGARGLLARIPGQMDGFPTSRCPQVSPSPEEFTPSHPPTSQPHPKALGQPPPPLLSPTSRGQAETALQAGSQASLVPFLEPPACLLCVHPGRQSTRSAHDPDLFQRRILELPQVQQVPAGLSTDEVEALEGILWLAGHCVALLQASGRPDCGDTEPEDTAPRFPRQGAGSGPAQTQDAALAPHAPAGSPHSPSLCSVSSKHAALCQPRSQGPTQAVPRSSYADVLLILAPKQSDTPGTDPEALALKRGHHPEAPLF